eukprot:8023574-Pyramimonas_sp.AAC.1
MPHVLLQQSHTGVQKRMAFLPSRCRTEPSLSTETPALSPEQGNQHHHRVHQSAPENPSTGFSRVEYKSH